MVTESKYLVIQRGYTLVNEELYFSRILDTINNGEQLWDRESEILGQLGETSEEVYRIISAWAVKWKDVKVREKAFSAQNTVPTADGGNMKEYFLASRWLSVT